MAHLAGAASHPDGVNDAGCQDAEPRYLEMDASGVLMAVLFGLFRESDMQEVDAPKIERTLNARCNIGAGWLLSRAYLLISKRIEAMER